jgi:hypothetical protein
MATKRPSKQKRAAQNRNQRAARAARAANANAAASPASGSGGGRASGGGGLRSRLRGGGTTTSASSARTRGAALRPDTPPGFRAALSALFAAVAAIFLLALILRYPVDAQGDVYTPETLTADWSLTALDAIAQQPDADAATIAESIDTWTPGRESKTALVALWPFSLAALLPLVGAALGFQAVRKRSSSKVVNRALYATLFGAVLTQGLLLLFLPVVLGLGVAMFQVRRAEMVARAGDGVIDVEAVDDEELLDDDGEDDDDELLDEDEDDEVIDVDAIDLDAPDGSEGPEDGAPRA